MPHLWLAGGLVALGLAILAYAFGRTDGARLERAKQDSAAIAVQQAVDKIDAATAERISKIQVTHTTIRQPVEREIRENVVYRNCLHAPDTLRMLNDALANRAASETPGGGELPAVDTPE